ncbi:MutS-related protein [Saccharicrinis fermentans]|uniref:DNA mismatch repair protein MutS n=1 Tax=Saccharicrinis fermentans DSM 9555 = JCM 21142 TaxID=869213 RepID=W7YA54_9BACT|nr:hypothetical protein [Saccharicrinis fermentans]GAF05202.1 DNA mismatch repair protein MutS [Saccharicrinis fermentans DSM 9555 = JCM 21142]
MGFVTDKQTLDDLNILGRYKNNSIFSLFNHTITSGGGRLLEKMFQHPFDDILSINKRRDIFALFEKINIALPFTEKEFDIVENYLRNTESKNRLLAAVNIAKIKFLDFVAGDKDYSAFREGLEKTIEIFARLKDLMVGVEQAARNTAYHAQAKKNLDLLTDKHFDLAYACIEQKPLSFKNVFKLDYIFRAYLNDRITELLNEIYELDIYIAVSNLAREKGYRYANAVDKSEKFIDIKGVYHPAIPNAIANDVYIGENKNVFFLTGANMAGKSTFMKSFSIAIYLAHMGFPVAAKEMNFALHDGIYTSINVPDNLVMGYSHFYAEVLRVKYIAQEVASDKQLVIVFDELFKGTNVKDAYDGTVSIVDAFSKRKGAFIISTHIMEAGQTLKESNDRLFFKYLPTVMKGSVPTYPYKLADGITDDRHGMIIIENEGILDIIHE